MRTVRKANGEKQTTVATPFQRLLATGVLPPETAQAWQRFREALDPCCLRQAIEQALEALDKLPNVTSGQVEDVHHNPYSGYDAPDIAPSLTERGPLSVTFSFDLTRGQI